MLKEPKEKEIYLAFCLPFKTQTICKENYLDVVIKNLRNLLLNTRCSVTIESFSWIQMHGIILSKELRLSQCTYVYNFTKLAV